MSSLSPLPLDGAGVSVSVKGGRRRGGKLGAGEEEVKVEVAAPAVAGRRRSRRAGQMPGADMEGARRRRRSRRAGQMPGADMEGARRRRRSRRAGQEAGRRHRSRKH